MFSRIGWCLRMPYGIAEFARVVISDPDTIQLPRDEDPQGQIEPNVRVALHQGRSVARISKHENLLIGELHADIARAGCVIDPREQGERAAFDRGDERCDRFEVSRFALPADHERMLSQRPPLTAVSPPCSIQPLSFIN